MEKDVIKTSETAQRELQATIELALDMENAFKMYSYRIIDTDAYLERVSEIVELYKERI